MKSCTGRFHDHNSCLECVFLKRTIQFFGQINAFQQAEKREICENNVVVDVTVFVFTNISESNSTLLDVQQLPAFIGCCRRVDDLILVTALIGYQIKRILENFLAFLFCFFLPFLCGLCQPRPDHPAGMLAEEFGDKPVAVCANLPYYITSPILMRLLEEKLPIENITVMVQKEAAQRLCAAPGTRDAGAISYAVAYYAEPKLLFTVQPGSFYPAPKVTSAVIRLNVRKTPAVEVPGGDEKAFFSLIRAAFSQRRKTAANAISNGLQLPKATVLSALEAAHLDPRSRPEQLTLQDYCALQAALQAGK